MVHLLVKIKCSCAESETLEHHESYGVFNIFETINFKNYVLNTKADVWVADETSNWFNMLWGVRCCILSLYLLENETKN